jgi:hypothetical protein
MTTETAVVVPEREKREDDALTRVKNWVIKTAEDYTALDAFLVGLNDLKKEIVADFAEAKEKTAKAKKAAAEAHKAVVDQEDGHLSVIEEARRLGKGKLYAYDQEQERERQRLQALEDARAQKEADDRAQAQALAAEQAGEKTLAQAILNEPARPEARKISTDVPKRSTNVSLRWSATVANPQFVSQAIAAAQVFMDKAKTPEAKAAAALLRQAHEDVGFMEYNAVALNAQAKNGTPYVNGVKKLGGVTFAQRPI